MGNSHEKQRKNHESKNFGGQSADRSLSWQPDPLFLPQMQPFPGHRGNFDLTPETPGPWPPNYPFMAGGFFPPPRPASEIGIGNSKPPPMENGSIVRNGKFFNGIQKISVDDQPAPNLGEKDSKNKLSRPGTNDSGYLTSGNLTDSDKSARQQQQNWRGSRLSLVDPSQFMPESEFYGPPPPPFHPYGAYPMPPPPGMYPHPMMFPPPPPFGPMPPQMVAPATPKKKRKYKRKSSMNKDADAASVVSVPAFYPMGPAMTMGPGLQFRAKSVDNVAMMAGGPLSDMNHRFSASQFDLNNGLPLWGPYGPPPPPEVFAPYLGAPVKEEKKKRRWRKGDAKKTPLKPEGSISTTYSENLSMFGKPLNRPPIGGETFGAPLMVNTEMREIRKETSSSPDESSKDTSPHERIRRTNGGGMATNTKDYSIYESLKGNKRLTTTAEINVDSVFNKSADENRNPTDSASEKPVVISPEAKIIMERNAAMIGGGENEPETKFPSNSAEKRSANLQSKSFENNDVGEPIIEASLNPTIPRQKVRKPKDFEPVGAWRDINVTV